ncbi:MAG: hypothetical protein H7Y17_11065 [Chlorobia bacterium]|nr:hypothetical protein [Fimbriimonadaceae bacterium]
MTTLAVALALAAPVFAPAQPWALNFAAPPRIPLVGDVNADGYADLICVYAPGASIIDVSLNQQGQKSGRPFQGLNPWGKDCQAAVAFEVDETPGADVLGLFNSDQIRIAGAYANRRFKDSEWLKLPKKLENPALIVQEGTLFAFSKSGRTSYRIDLKSKKVESASKPRLPNSPDVILSGDIDKDGDQDQVVFRYGKEQHTANQILVQRLISSGETDSDSDGLLTEEEERLGTDPLNPDTDQDGLIDGWEVGTFRGLDFKSLGCNPRRMDVICYVARFDEVDENHFRRELTRAVETYSKLDVLNHDGSKGWGLRLIYLDPIKGDDKKNAWWGNRDKFIPAKHRGIAHFMQVSQGGGGQADQLGDGGGCGANALWAVFMHEFGHQIGMDHNGFWSPAFCPIYRSLMNYAYSYSLEDDYNKIAYSKGELAGYTLKETDLDEEIPLPYERVKFLEKGPYRFRLKPNGKTTLIDWNWNGVFGEKGIRADINYSYAIGGGRRDDVGKSHTSPWLAVHKNEAYVFFGQPRIPGDKKNDPTLSLNNPGKLLYRKLIEPFRWQEPMQISEDLTGDPVAISHNGYLVVFYQTARGVLKKTIGVNSEPEVVSSNTALVPTVGASGNRLYLFLWDPTNLSVTFRMMVRGKWVGDGMLSEKSTIPVGFTVDTIRKQVVIGMAQDQDDKRPSRWQVRWYEETKDGLEEKRMDWIEGEKGQTRGKSRCTLLFERTPNSGPEGRLRFFGQGMTSAQSPWACTYVAEQISDKSVKGGWLVKRFYDEWTQTRSAPAATWFKGDILWSYRWVDGGQGPTDNNLHVAYKATGIEDTPMGDHDDLSYFRDFGIRHSIIYLSEP